jgi:hypothetical protein
MTKHKDFTATYYRIYNWHTDEYYADIHRGPMRFDTYESAKKQYDIWNLPDMSCRGQFQIIKETMRYETVEETV